MPLLTARQKRTLTAICNTLIPTLPPEPGLDVALSVTCGQDFDLTSQIEEAVLVLDEPSQELQIKLFLTSLDQPLTNKVMGGHFGRFSHLDLNQRTAVLQAWAHSRHPLARKAFQSVKRLAFFLFYGYVDGSQTNPVWPAIGYTPPPPVPSTVPAKTIRPLEIPISLTHLETDVLVIGSGAGGGVVAGELTAAGHDVLVVEKGGYYAEPDFHQQELAGFRELFERQGTFTTADLSMVVLAGSNLGGGTTVNWMASLRPPDYTRQEWAQKYGFTAVTGAEFEASLAAVIGRCHIDSDESGANRQNNLLVAGSAARGYPSETIPRNALGCDECGHCNFGCRTGAKQGTLKTYLQDAFDGGARILVNTHVDTIWQEHGVAVGANVTVCHPDGRRQSLIIKAKRVVVAAGTLHTPALLLRSGLRNGNIGRHVHLHPTTATLGVYEEAVRCWQGPPLTRIVTAMANLDGKGYGCWLEVAPTQPGLMASAMPWQSGRQHKGMMAQADHIGNHIVLVRDIHGGQIKLNRRGYPVLHYQLHPDDQKHMKRGIMESLHMHHATGAHHISAPHSRYLSYDSRSSRRFEDFLREVEKTPLSPNAFALFSAHQMSSCRLAHTPALGVVKPNGESYDLGHLYVADGSVLPTAVGVNPMLTIMATAHHIAQHIKSSL